MLEPVKTTWYPYVTSKSISGYVGAVSIGVC